MTNLKMYLFAGIIACPCIISAQISNVKTAAEDDKFVITYDYAEEEESVDNITVSYTFTSGDSTLTREARALTGDYSNVTPGEGKTITWRPLDEMESFEADNLVFHLTGVRDKVKQTECDENLSVADRFFADKDYANAILYYARIEECVVCNCNPKDVRRSTEQVRLSRLYDKFESSKDKFHASYLFDMATAEGGGSLHGVSAFLLRSKTAGYYASFRSNSGFYSAQTPLSYYEPAEGKASEYEMKPLTDTRVASWLFSTGVTYPITRFENISLHLYGGLGIGANSVSQSYRVAEKGYSDERWIADGKQNLFFSPEVGLISNIYEYVSLMAGLKLPLSMTKTDAISPKGFGVMLGAGIKLKSIPRDGYGKANTYVAYTMDIPQQSGPDKIQSLNIIGISAGTVAYHKLGAYISARINPLLISPKEEKTVGENATYTGVNDYANAFGTIGLTWMYFYGGIGVSYQKEYKEYNDVGTSVWSSPGNKIGLCTEFGLNLRLFDSLLLRGGVTMPNFKLSSTEGKFTMGSDRMYFSLGLGYVLPASN